MTRRNDPNPPQRLPMTPLPSRRLGRTGIVVSEIAMGTVELGLPYGIGVTREEQLPSEQDAVELLRQALDAGVTFFDTAPAYGRAEKLVGEAFHDRRERVVLATKCAEVVDEHGRLRHGADLQRAMEAELQQSLQTLRTDVVDVYLFHRFDPEIAADAEVARVLDRFRRKGWIRAAGASVYGLPAAQAALDAGHWEVLQVAFNLMDQRAATLFPQAEQQGVGLMARSVLLKGVLSARGEKLHPALAAVQAHRAAYQALLSQRGGQLSDLATQFALAYRQISSVLLGIDRAEYLEQAIRLAQSPGLTPDQIQRAEALAFPTPEFLDLSRWAREGWLV